MEIVHAHHLIRLVDNQTSNDYKGIYMSRRSNLISAITDIYNLIANIPYSDEDGPYVLAPDEKHLLELRSKRTLMQHETTATLKQLENQNSMIDIEERDTCMRHLEELRASSDDVEYRINEIFCRIGDALTLVHSDEKRVPELVHTKNEREGSISPASLDVINQELTYRRLKSEYEERILEKNRQVVIACGNLRKINFHAKLRANDVIALSRIYVNLKDILMNKSVFKEIYV